MHHQLTQFTEIDLVFKDSPDPKDDYLFDLALQTKSDYLITGDKKLLAMEKVEDMQITSLRDFKDLISGD